MISRNRHTRILKGIACILVALCASAPSALANMYDRYKDADVTVRDRTGGERDQPIILRDINSRAIMYSPMNYRQGVLELPLSNEELRLFYQYPAEQWNNVLRSMKLGGYEQAVEILRPMAYPLVKFLVVPEERFNGHQIVVRLYESLIMAEMLDEAVELAYELPFDMLNDRFIELTIDLASALIDKGETMMAIRAIQVIPLTPDRSHLMPEILRFANTLRERDEFEAALILYGRLRGFPDEEIQQTANLWTAYIHLLLEQYDTAKSFLEIIGEIDKTEDTYSLIQLIKGRLQLNDGELVEATNTIAQGVVKSDVSYPWAPDLLYSSGLCYESLDDHESLDDNKLIAANIYYQLKLFFPKNKWTKLAEQRMASLPMPAEVEATLPDEEFRSMQGSDATDALMDDDDDEWGEAIE